MRPSRPLTFMEHAHVESRRATCFRNSIGCVIVSQRTRGIVATGYNGPPSGQPHCEGHLCDGAETGCVRAIHAEVNALRKLDHRIQDYMDLYVTLSPCGKCLVNIEDDGRVKRIFYETEYRSTAHLRVSTIPFYRVTQSGYITRFGGTTLIDPESFYAIG